MKSYAIVIAVEQYSDPGIASVKHAKHDAEQLSAALALHGIEPADQLLLVDEQATKSVVEAKIRKLLGRLQSDDMLYLFYAGQGFSSSEQSFLACYDTQLSVCEETGVSLDALLSDVLSSECEQIVFLLDCSHAEEMATGFERFSHHELVELQEETDRCICYVSCQEEETSHASGTLQHGIWAHHLMEAFRGEAPLALEHGLLTASSLQSYLQAEIPRTLRKTTRGPLEQSPCLYGAASKDFMLADLRELLHDRRETANEEHDLVTRVSFLIEERARLKSLSGWKRSYSIPDQDNPGAERFIAQLAAEELSREIDDLYQALKRAFRFSRRDLEAAVPADGTGTIITPHFHYSLTVALNPTDFSEVIWTRTVDTIKHPDEVTSAAFASVFDGIFDTLEFTLPTPVNLEDIVDAFEAAQLTDLTLHYDRELTYCELHLPGAMASIVIRPKRLVILHEMPQSTRQLIESFESVRMLVNKHEVPLLLFE